MKSHSEGKCMISNKLLNIYMDIAANPIVVYGNCRGLESILGPTYLKNSE